MNLASNTGLPIVVKEDAALTLGASEPANAERKYERKHEHPWKRLSQTTSSSYPGDPRVPLQPPLFIPQLGRVAGGDDSALSQRATCFYPLVSREAACQDRAHLDRTPRL